MSFHNIYNWDKLGAGQLNIMLIFTTIVMLAYLYVIYLDLKSREMYFWVPFLAGNLNFILPGIALFFFGPRKVVLALLIGFVLWYIFLFLDAKFNKEKFIGRADMVILYAQVILSTIYILASRCELDAMYSSIVMFVNIENIMAAILLGLFLVVVVWSISILRRKLKNGTTFKEEAKGNNETPLTLAFIPWVFLNLLMLMGL